MHVSPPSPGFHYEPCYKQTKAGELLNMTLKPTGHGPCQQSVRFVSLGFLNAHTPAYPWAVTLSTEPASRLDAA